MRMVYVMVSLLACLGINGCCKSISGADFLRHSIISEEGLKEPKWFEDNAYQIAIGKAKICSRVVVDQPLGLSQVTRIRDEVTESVNAFVQGYEDCNNNTEISEVYRKKAYLESPHRDSWYHGYVSGWRLAAMESREVPR